MLTAGSMNREIRESAGPVVRRSLVAGVRRLLERLREGVPLSAFVRGMWLRRHFNTDGLILALPGGPMPTVKNRGGRIDIESCSFESRVRLELYPGATLQIGKGTYLNRNVHIVVGEAVTIGRGVKVGWDVVIMDTDLHGHSGQEAVTKPVSIEDDVWIGCRALILKGVRIGRGAVVAAGAIVTKDVPPFAIVASPRADIVASSTGSTA
jgi:acetyltransferase-like isoleucine patch superfamily enzyme